MPGVKTGAMLRCSMGMAPSTLLVIPPLRNANMTDTVPIANIQPFGMCTSMANPTVAAATAAAQGVLTPMPCVPMTISGWVPCDPTQLVDGRPAVTQGSILMCSWAGTINILTTGE